MRDVYPAGGWAAISIHVLREEDDIEPGVVEPPDKISIHVLREEDDGMRLRSRARASNFYPRPPRGGRLTQPANGETVYKFLSTSSARRTTCARGH